MRQGMRDGISKKGMAEVRMDPLKEERLGSKIQNWDFRRRRTHYGPQDRLRVSRALASQQMLQRRETTTNL
jgi:hypothetical protein